MHFLKLVIHNRRSFNIIFPPQILNEYLPGLWLRVETSEIHQSNEKKKITFLMMITICRGKKIKQHRNTCRVKLGCMTFWQGLYVLLLAVILEDLH